MSSAKTARRFSHRVFKFFALSLLAVSAIFTGYFHYVARERLENNLVDRGRLLAGLLASGAKTAAYSENAILVQDTLQGVLEHREVLWAAIYTVNRGLITAQAKSPALLAQARTLTGADIALLESPQLRTECMSQHDIGHVDIFCPILIRAGAVSGLELNFESPAVATRDELVGFAHLTLDRGPLQRDLTALLLRNMVLSLALLLIGTVLTFLLSRRVTEPLAHLTAAVRAFGTGTGTGTGIREITCNSADEIGRLAEAFTTMIHDLSDREREKEKLAERLREARKMEAVGTLSQGIAHDFKNILSTLMGAVHILQKGSQDNEFVLKYTGKMQVSLDRARDLVERLVVFSRTRQLQAVPVDLGLLLTRQTPLLREALGESVRLQVESPGGAVPVLGDAASLEQLLSNLAYNARDAMPEGGTLFLRLETVAGATVRGPGTARITVRDTGVGMELETRRRLFEPFFTTKDFGDGMGLGLSIVHGIVEQHHGRIEVESEPGRGTTFRVELPLLEGVDDGSQPVSGADAGA